MTSIRHALLVRSRLRRGFSLLGVCALGAICAVVVAGCGSASNAAGTDGASTTASTTTSTSTSTTALSASFQAYQQCLTAHGGTAFTPGRGGYPGFGGRPTGASGPAGASGFPSGASGFTRPKPSAAEQKAMADCASLRPTFTGASGFAGGGFTNNPALAKYTTCMKDHGVTLGPGVSRTSSAFQAATKACASDLPAGGFGGFGGGGAPSSSSFAKTQACLKSHGVNIADASATPAAKLQAAYAARRNAGVTTTTTTSS